MSRVNGLRRSSPRFAARSLMIPVLFGAMCAAPTLAQPTPAAPPAPRTPAAPAAPAATAPATTKKIAQPKVKLYDESADAKAQIAAALKTAKGENKRVLIQWGGNWCGWCTRLHELSVKDREISKELLYEYVIVHVDAGIEDKNLDLANTYKAEIQKGGFPYLTVLDGEGKVLANQETGSLEVKDDKGESKGLEAGHDPKKVLAFLKAHEAAPLAAKGVLEKGVAEAKSSGKSVFVHFGAPWCIWCHRLEDWMARPEVGALLAKDYVSVKIDTDRMTGGQEMLDTLSVMMSGGIPWSVMLAGSGAAVINSNSAGGNIGFPATAEEIAHFGEMLNKTRKNLTDQDVKTLLDSLRAETQKREESSGAGH